MASNNKRERHWVYLDSANDGEYGWKYLDQYMLDHQCRSRGEAIEAIFVENYKLNIQVSDHNNLVDEIVDKTRETVSAGVGKSSGQQVSNALYMIIKMLRECQERELEEMSQLQLQTGTIIERNMNISSAIIKLLAHSGDDIDGK